jgi:hypothetical protein
VQFDDQLRQAFRRQEPDAGFAERTLAVIGARSREARALHRTAAGWLGIAAALLLILGGVNAALKNQRAVRARQDVELALRIASETLNHVQVKLAEASARKGMSDAR